jgi:chitinase
MKQISKFPSYVLLFFYHVSDLQNIILWKRNLKQNICRIVLFFALFLTASGLSNAQLPAKVLVGYHENWNSELLTQAHANYNVINLAFGVPKKTGPTGTCMCDMVYTRPPGYATNALFMADIDALHAAGKKVLLSIGGANDPIFLANATDKTTFINSMNAIFATYSNKIDGIDLDLEGASMKNSSSAAWTMSTPLPEQTNLITAIQSIMATYQTNTGKKMLLTMAPEVYYCTGALGSGQIGNWGGIFLPIIDGLRTELDLLQMQLYNAPGGMVAWNGTIYNEGNPDFTLALNETMIKGFTCLSGKGNFVGLPASKIAFGYPANTAAAGSGFLSYANICNAVKYFKGTIANPGGAGWSYTMTASYPTLRGLMTWDIYLDKYSSAPSYAFATNYTCAFTLPVALLNFDAKRFGDQVNLNWATANETNNNYFSLEYSSDGISFSEIAKINGLGNSNSGQKYDYTDYNVSASTSYYRLAQYDFDGTVTYSGIITAASEENTGLHIGANPFEEVLIVSPYANEGNGEASVSLLDASGKLISTKNIRINEEGTIGAECKSGFYILEFQFNGETKRYKIIKN